jgi:hypothetical protein
MNRRHRYLQYIASEKWRNSPARLAEIAEAHNRCRLCFRRATAAAPLEVHHATYRRMGAECRGDLVALCHECHDKTTSIIRARRYRRRRPRHADVQQLRDMRHSFIDPTKH